MLLTTRLAYTVKLMLFLHFGSIVLLVMQKYSLYWYLCLGNSIVKGAKISIPQITPQFQSPLLQFSCHLIKDSPTDIEALLDLTICDCVGLEPEGTERSCGCVLLCTLVYVADEFIFFPYARYLIFILFLHSPSALVSGHNGSNNSLSYSRLI